MTYPYDVNWLLALIASVVFGACPAAPPSRRTLPPEPAPTGPPGEVIGQGDPGDPDGPGAFDPDGDPDRGGGDGDGDGADDFDDADHAGDDMADPPDEPFDPDMADPDDDQPEDPAPAPVPVKPTGKDPEPAGPLRGILAAHNKVRAAHCAAPLKWSDKLAAVAQKWADTLAARGCAFEHSRGKYGENLAFAAPAGTHTSKTATDGWYREVKIYDFNDPRFSFEAGHFTQVVWRGSTTLGCGYATCSGGRAELWVCNYDPPGNVSRSFSANVLPTSCRSR